jgi:excisionase family DNA binding protein
MSEYLTVDQAATLLHVSPTTVRRWIYQGSLKAKKQKQGEMLES